jgi:hypothetical protein
MAYDDLRTILQLWNQSDQDSERKIQKFLLKGLDTIVQADCDILSMVKVGDDVYTPVVRWMEEKGYPTKVTGQLATATITYTGNVFHGQTISAETIKQVLTTGTILQRESDGMQCIITDVTGLASASYQTTVAAHGGYTLSDDSAGVTYRILSEPKSDYTESGNPRSLDRGFLYVGSQIHGETFEIPWTRKNTKYELVANETEHQIMALLDKLKRQLGYAVVNQAPVYSGGVPIYGDQTQTPTMCGIFHWPKLMYDTYADGEVYVDLSDKAVTKTDFDTLARNMQLNHHTDFKKGDWKLLCHPLVHDQIHDYDEQYVRTTRDEKVVGRRIMELDLKVGITVPVVSDQYVLPGQACLADMSKMHYSYYNNDKMNRKEIATKNRVDEWYISFQTVGVVVRKPIQSLGMIYNIAT